MVTKQLRKGKNHRVFETVTSCISMILLSSPAAAYLGPGAGLGMIASLVAVIVVVIIIILGLVIYPVRMLRKRRRDHQANDNNSKAAD